MPERPRMWFREGRPMLSVLRWPRRPAPLLVDDTVFPRFRWVVIAQVVAQQQVAPLVFFTLGVMLPSMQADLNFGAVEAGWLGAVRSAGNLLVFPASILLVRFSPIKVFNTFSILLGATLMFGAFSPSFWVLFFSLAIYSVGMSWGQIPMNMIRQQWIPPREMATVMGGIMSANTVIQSAGLVLIPVIVATFGSWRVIFSFNSVVLFTIAIVWFLTARERISPSYAAARSADRGMASARVVLRRREFYLLGTAAMGGATTFMTFMLFLPSYYVEERGFSLQAAGAVTAVIPLGGLLVNLLAGYVSDRIGRRKPLIWPSGIVLPGLWFLLLTPLPPAWLAVVGVAVGAAAWLPFPILQTIPLEIEGLSPADRAVGQALQFTIMTIGQLVGPLIVGTMVGITGSYYSGLLPLIFLPTLFIWTSFFIRETGSAARPVPVTS